MLTTVNHLNRSVYELTVDSSRGKIETLRPTGAHKFYRAQDSSWVSAMDLRVGDTLRGVDGMLTVRRVVAHPGVHRVYNMTVEGEHVYRVARLGVLVHNNNCKRAVPDSNAKPLPALDGKGKVHGDLPEPQDFGRYSRDELEGLRDDLKKSVQERISKNSDLGPKGNHGLRQRQEQDLIKDLDKFLGD